MKFDFFLSGLSYTWCIFEYNYLRKKLIESKGFIVKNDQEKLELFGQGCGWVTRLRVPYFGVYGLGSGHRTKQCTLAMTLLDDLWLLAPFRAPCSPCFLPPPTFFQLSFLQSYPFFLVDFYTLRYI